jgi:hypothetical protein
MEELYRQAYIGETFIFGTAFVAENSAFPM